MSRPHIQAFMEGLRRVRPVHGSMWLRDFLQEGLQQAHDDNDLKRAVKLANQWMEGAQWEEPPDGPSDLEAHHDALLQAAVDTLQAPEVDWRPPESTPEDYHTYSRPDQPIRLARSEEWGHPAIREFLRVIRGHQPRPGFTGRHQDTLRILHDALAHGDLGEAVRAAQGWWQRVPRPEEQSAYAPAYERLVQDYRPLRPAEEEWDSPPGAGGGREPGGPMPLSRAGSPIRLAQDPYRGGWYRDEEAPEGWDYRPQGIDLMEALSHGVLGADPLEHLLGLVDRTFPVGHPIQKAWEAAMMHGDPLALRQVLDALQDEGVDLGPVLGAGPPGSGPATLPEQAEGFAGRQARLDSHAGNHAWEYGNDRERWAAVSPGIDQPRWQATDRLEALREGPEEGQAGPAAWAQRARDFLARVGRGVRKEVGLALKPRAQLEREWEEQIARTQAQYLPPPMREPTDLPADDPMSAESVGRLRDSTRVAPNPTGQPPQRNYNQPQPAPLGGVAQYNPGPLDPPARYAGTHSPAGGVVVRGLYYPGGKFIPGKAPRGGHEMDKGTLDQYQAIQSQRARPRPTRRGDGSYPPVTKE